MPMRVDTLTFEIAGMPAWASFDMGTGALTGTPTAAGTFSDIIITVSDSTDSVSLAAFSITVSPAANNAPVISGTPATTVPQDNVYSFTPTASDADAGATLSFSISNKPTWASFNTASGALTGTPGNADVGVTNGVVITVTDQQDSASLAQFNITVTNVNDAPTISGTPSTTIADGTAYNFMPTASDIDVGDSLIFDITNKPDWATFSNTTGALTGTPDNTDAGTTNGVVISVSDGQASAALPAFNLSVTTSNQAPTISGTPVSDIMSTQTYSFTPTASDADVGDNLIFDITNKPDWASFDTDSGALTGTPSDANVGTTNGVVISVSDGQTSASLAAFDITVYVDSTAGNGGTGNINFSNKVPANYLWDTLDTGRLMFVDRDYLFATTADNQIPATYMGMDYLRTAKDDSNSTGNSLISFDVDIPVTVYVAHADQITSKPAWLDSSWTDTGDDIVLRSIYKKNFISGTVTLGGNKANGTDSGSMYFVFIEPFVGGGTGSATLQWTPPTTYTNGDTMNDLDGYEIHYGTQSGPNYSDVIVLNNEGLTEYTISDLPAGDYFFNIKSFTSGSGAPRSAFAGEVTKTIVGN